MAAKSKTRQTEVKPNWNFDHYRASSSMAGKARRPPQFFKIILPSAMQHMKLRIPEKFVMEFGDELSTVATLTAPYGGIWQVGLKKADNNIWFCNGWQDFVEYHSICYGYFLVFRYEGNSSFHVLIFDKTATEIQYPSSKNFKLEDRQVEIIDLDEDDTTISSHDSVNENKMSPSDDLPTMHYKVREKFGRKTFSSMSSKGKLKMSRGQERAIQAAEKFKPKNPSFMGISRPRNYMYVPAEFAIKYIIGMQFVTLQTTDGKQWQVFCYYNRHTRSGMNLGRGWAAFSKDNNLEVGDVCVFEVIEKKPVVFSVSIFHVVDHQSSY